MTREGLYAAVAAQLESISPANGYGLTVDKVYRVDVTPDEMPSTVRRALLVLESLTPEQWEYLAGGGTTQGGYMVKGKMIVAGVIRTGDTDGKSSKRATEINALFNEAVAALMEDATFGGGNSVQTVIESPVLFVDTDKQEAAFNLTLKYIYSFGYGEL